MPRPGATSLPLTVSAATEVLLSAPCLHTQSESRVASYKVRPAPGDAAMLQLRTGCELGTAGNSPIGFGQPG
jgi:hypothetical protein